MTLFWEMNVSGYCQTFSMTYMSNKVLRLQWYRSTARQQDNKCPEQLPSTWRLSCNVGSPLRMSSRLCQAINDTKHGKGLPRSQGQRLHISNTRLPGVECMLTGRPYWLPEGTALDPLAVAPLPLEEGTARPVTKCWSLCLRVKLCSSLGYSSSPVCTHAHNRTVNTYLDTLWQDKTLLCVCSHYSSMKGTIHNILDMCHRR